VTEAMAAAPPASAASSASPSATTTDATTDAPAGVRAGAPAETSTGVDDAALDPSTPEGVKACLASMGFTDASMVATAIEKNGVDVEACARDLAAASEWEALLDDLAEMGFTNRELNQTLMLKHSGNVKRTVRELVEDGA